MARKKKLINNTSIPQREIEIIARCIFPDILAFYYSNNTAQQWLIWIALILAALYFYRYTMCQ